MIVTYTVGELSEIPDQQLAQQISRPATKDQANSLPQSTEAASSPAQLMMPRVERLRKRQGKMACSVRLLVEGAARISPENGKRCTTVLSDGGGKDAGM